LRVASVALTLAIVVLGVGAGALVLLGDSVSGAAAVAFATWLTAFLVEPLPKLTSGAYATSFEWIVVVGAPIVGAGLWIALAGLLVELGRGATRRTKRSLTPRTTAGAGSSGD
jgi:hypothetical protein